MILRVLSMIYDNVIQYKYRRKNLSYKRKVPDLGEIGHDRGIKFSVEELNNSYGDIIS